MTSKAKYKAAVFDADGTLWHDDVAECFFQFQIERGLAPGAISLPDPFQTYLDIDAVSTRDSSLWLAQINAGLFERELRRNVKKFYEETKFIEKLNPFLKELIDDLKKEGFDIWICSASPKWTLEPTMDYLKLPHDRLIATEVKVDTKGKLTNEAVEPVPYAEGKAKCVEKLLPARPLLVAGNSRGDLEMLKLATELPLAIVYQPHRPHLEKSEGALLKEAAKSGWPIQIFRAGIQVH